ncbi:MAG TPA: GNAT family N-acetyltransferase [Anaerolineales bacterium]|nr:GNAT family N-acetyltransferase [Anaerolineales bacterium]
MPTSIVAEHPDSTDARALIAELEAYLAPLYPAESQHGLSIEQLLREKVAFFVVRQDGAAAGCGGVQLFGTTYGEVKRMYIRPQYRGLGLAKRLLEHLEAYAREHDVKLLRLETGIQQSEAIGLYERMGFHCIPPFGAYQEDPLSRFYEKRIG